MTELATCNQCSHELCSVMKPILFNRNVKKYILNDDNITYDIIYICTNPECPNYALLQIPLERMP